MLSVHNLNKNFGVKPILQNINFNISAGERSGLIGPNGSGKTTLLRILAGLEGADSGVVTSTRPNLRIGYLAQGLDLPAELSLQAALGSLSTSLEDPASEVESLASALAKTPNDLTLQAVYDEALARLLRDAEPKAILGPLGLGDLHPQTPLAHLSGGQKTRLMLARVLLGEPHLLLLDEPTNHLDIEMLEWLEEWINRFQGAALIVSHDRAFLDHTVTTILELDPSTQAVRSYPGNYSGHLEQKLAERKKLEQSFQDQQEELAQLRAAAARIRGLTRMKKGGKSDSGDKFAAGFFGNRATKNVAGRAKHIEARVERMLTEERIEKPRPAWQMKLDFGAPAHHSREVLVTLDLSVGYGADRPLLTGLNLQIRAGQHIALTGPNGAGKTCLLRTIVGKLDPLGGQLKLGASIKPGYMSQEQELLDPNISALKTIQGIAPFNETEARNFLHYFLFEADDPLRPTRELSHGERARLQLGLLVAQGCDFLLLDEPINHLDIPSRLRFEKALASFKGTILAVVHDRYFIERFATDLWTVTNGSIKR